MTLCARMRVRSRWLPVVMSACAAITGCGPGISRDDLGTIVFEVPTVPGTESPYPLPVAAPGEGLRADSRRPTQDETREDLAKALPDLQSPPPATSRAAFEETRRLARWLGQRFPTDAESQDLAASLLLWVGDSMEAVACWEKCLALDPGFAAAYERLGLLAMKRADYPKAVEMLRKSVSLRPDAPMAQIDLGTALMAAGRLEEAIAVLDRYVGAAVDPTPGLILLGRAHLSLGNWSQARDHYEIAVKLRPQISDGHFGLASAYARLGDAEKARHAMANFKALKADEEKRRKTELARYDDLDDLRRLMATAYAGAADRCVQSGLASEAASLRRKAQAIAPQMDPGAQRFQGVPSPKSHRY